MSLAQMLKNACDGDRREERLSDAINFDLAKRIAAWVEERELNALAASRKREET
jgi:hypothetical protein